MQRDVERSASLQGIRNEEDCWVLRLSCRFVSLGLPSALYEARLASTRVTLLSDSLKYRYVKNIPNSTRLYIVCIAGILHVSTFHCQSVSTG